MKLYIYEHCPYCVKARMIFGIRNIDCELKYVFNDDAELPISLVGRKVVPILQKPDGSHMPESMDIVHFVNDNAGFAAIKPSKNDARLNEIMQEMRAVVYHLAMPRWIQLGFPEYARESAKAWFLEKKEQQIGTFAENLKNSAELISKGEKSLQNLSDFMKNENFIFGELSEDDFHLFPYLRSFSVVKGIKFPVNVLNYANNMARLSKVPNHFDIAL